MPACPYGAVVIPGSPEWVLVTDAWMFSYFGSDFMLAINGAAGMLDYGPYRLADIAAENPSTPLAFDLTDVLDIFGAPAAIDQKRLLLNAWIRYYLFTEYCQCVSLAPSPCDVPWVASEVVNHYTYDELDWSSGGQPAGISRLRGSYSAAIVTGAPENYAAYAAFYSDELGTAQIGGNVLLNFIGTTFGTVYTFDLIAPAGCHNCAIYSYPRYDNDATIRLTGAGYFTTMCTGHTDVPAPPALPDVSAVHVDYGACETIADLCAKLTAIESRISGIAALQHAQMIRDTPYSYVPGTPVAVAGEGYLAVSGALGCLVHVTSVPPGWGGGTGADPRRIPATGSIRWGTADGADRGVGIRQSQQMVLDAPPFTTRILYTFRPFVTATITPLYPAP